MGILDILTGNPGAASPWGMLYGSPLFGPDPQQTAVANAAALGGMGVDPASLPQVDPFGDPKKLSVAAPPAPLPGGFGTGAVPFGFAGPGSMNVTPSQIAGPAAPASAPAAPPAAPQAPAAPQPAAPPTPSNDEAAPAAPAAAAAPPGAGSPAPFSLGGG